MRERDWYDAKEHCHFVPGLLRYANNHEFVAMVAPRPLLIISAHNDHSFRIPGNRAVADYGSRLYHALGAGDRIGYFEDEKEADSEINSWIDPVHFKKHALQCA